ncbi:MAG: hypothetical protein ABH871_10330 [Pseudomonadota bacterium]
MDDWAKEILACAADPDLGLRQLKSFEKAYAKATDCQFNWDVVGAHELVRIFGNSRVLSERLISHPQWANDVALSPYSIARKPKDVISAEIGAMVDSAGSPSPLPLSPFDSAQGRPQGRGSENAFMTALRHYKYREMARIVMRDIACSANVRQLLAEWSDVADVLIQAAWQRAYDTLVQKFGKPMCPSGNGNDAECEGAVIALGKLGGRELNLSSDIDLITIYASDEGGTISHSKKNISNHEFYVQQTALFTKLLSKVTNHGFVFRVDHDLRPEGAGGPLSNSLDAAERYYEYFGHDWERQALMRARPVAGSEKLGNAFIDAVRPFIYRRSVTLKDLAHMKEMKKKMELSSKRKSDAYDIKLGPGGIREVEFLTQAICLFFGGTLTNVRQSNTFEAIDALAKAALIHPYGAARLRNAYSFLRRTENMLQAADDLQIHKLPKQRAELCGLARRMGYRNLDAHDAADEFMSDLMRHRQGVERLFKALFVADYERLELMDAIRDNAARAENEEEEIESLAWFKTQETKRIQESDIAGSMPLSRVMRRLTLAAEAILECAWDMAKRQLEEKYGAPLLEDGSRAGFAIVGMGSLGSSEVDYGSDLDLCFIYRGPGKTSGERSISNVEYFTKLAQRIIFMVSMPGRYGRAYQVDSELRPSGSEGTLVASIESFHNYHKNDAHIWERLSLLKARVITGDDEFIKQVRSELSELAYKSPPPPADKIKEEIARIRERTISERIKPKTHTYNIKIGPGGSADADSIIQFYQLIYAKDHVELWKQNSFEVLGALHDSGLMDSTIFQELENHISFYKKILSGLRLLTGRATDEINMEADYIDALAEHMNCTSRDEPAEEIKRHMNAVETLFNKEIAQRS